MLSGVTAGFLRKSNFVVVEAEGDGGVPVIKTSATVGNQELLKDLHSIANFSLEQETVNSIKNTLQSGVGGPVTVKDAVADASMSVDIRVEETSNETAFGRESGEIVGHLEVEHEVAVLVGSFGRLDSRSLAASPSIIS